MTDVRHIMAQGAQVAETEWRLEFARWSAGNELLIGAIVSAIGLYAVWWLYRREARGRFSRRMRLALFTCRMLVLVTLGLIGLEPVLVRYDHRRVDAQTLVLVDSSASMALSDVYRDAHEAARIETVFGQIPAGGVERHQLAHHLLDRGSAGLLSALASRNDVRLFGFADSLQPQGVVRRANPSDGPVSATQPAGDEENPDSPDLEPPDGSATDLGLAVRGAIDAASGAPISGVLVLSDGGFNQGESAGVVARFLQQKQIPVFAVGIGDAAEPINARVVHVSAPRTAFKDDPFSVTVKLALQGDIKDDLRLELFEQREGSEPELIDNRTVRPDSDGRLAPVVFERNVKKPGTVRYTARIAPLAYESVTSDNNKDMSPGIRILDDQMKVLLIAGAPSYDYRFLARMFERDPTVKLSTWLQSADARAVRDGDVVIDALPTGIEEINKYDAIILMDCDPSELDPTWASVISMFVSDHGGGLLYAAGNKYTGRFLRHEKTRSIVDLLPVVADPEAELVINELGHYQTKAWPLIIPDEAVGDLILRQSEDPSQTRGIWNALGQIYWHYPVRRGKPVAQVLMRHSNPRMANAFGQHVLFATQFVGTGRTAWLGINSTWRWRRADEKHFNRFWIQTLRFLVEGKLLGGRARGQILTSKDAYEQGEVVVATVRALDEQFNPLLVPELEMKVAAATRSTSEDLLETPDSRTVELFPIAGREGHYEGRFVARETGTFQLSVRLPGVVSSETGGQSLEKEIEVNQSDLEMRDTAMNRAGLREFAMQAGGPSAYFDVDEATKIADVIPDMSRTFIVRGRPEAIWDNGVVLTVLIGLLSLEWILRKKARLL